MLSSPRPPYRNLSRPSSPPPNDLRLDPAVEAAIEPPAPVESLSLQLNVAPMGLPVEPEPVMPEAAEAVAEPAVPEPAVAEPVLPEPAVAVEVVVEPTVDVGAFERRIAELESQVATQAEALGRQGAELAAAAEVSARIVELEQQLSDRSAQLEHALAGESRLGDLERELAAAAATAPRVAELERVVESGKRALEEATARAASLQALPARLQELESQIDSLQRELADRTAELVAAREDVRVVEAEPRVEPERAYAEGRSMLFVPRPEGYELVERSEAAPPVGETVELESQTFLVTRIGPAPLPGARVACAYLEHVA